MTTAPSQPSQLHLPYQATGIEWLITRKIALLGDEMGLGKTYQAIKALEHLNENALIICPAIARLTWRNEFLKWGSVNKVIQVISQTSDKPNPNARIVICSFNYATVNEDRAKLKATKTPTPAYNPHLIEWCKAHAPALIVDESHFLKSLQARRTMAILGKGALIHHVSRAWFLTGTPMPNAPHELWPFLTVAGRTTLTYESFMRTFCKTYSFNGQLVPDGAKRSELPRLKALLEPVMLRRLKKDVLKDLPTVMHSEIMVEPTVSSIPVINEEQKALLKVLGLTDPLEQMRALEVCAKSISTLRRFCGLQKIDTVGELIGEELKAKAYDKIVIFGIHKEVIQKLAHILREFGVVVVCGDTPAALRQLHIDDFQNSPATRVFIGNIQAAGTNITLTKANQMVFIEEDFVPGNNAQAVARCDRIGQTLPVNVRYIRLTNSIDQKINEILLRKSTDQKLLLGA